MYHRKMEKQMRNIKSVKTPTPPELSDDNKRSLPQVQTSNWTMSDRSTPILRNKHLWHQRPHSNDAKMIHLVPTDYTREISSGIPSVMDLKSTIHHILIWELLSPSSTTLKIEERGPGYSRSAASSYSRSRSERPRQ
jgi:hypothetical protein